MNRQLFWLLIAMLAAPASALAQLPPLSPDEAMKKAEAAEKKAAGEEAAKAALAKAQDRVAKRYRAKPAMAAARPASSR